MKHERSSSTCVLGRAGFTLIEMLVVIAIIAILVSSTSVFFLEFTQSQGLRSAATEFESAFNQAQREASNTRQGHFLVFKRQSGDRSARLVIVKDVNRNGDLDYPSGNDEMVLQHSMQPFVHLALDGDDGAGPTVNNGTGPWWILFASDGSISSSSGTDGNPSQNPFTENRSMGEIGTSSPTMSNNVHDFLITRRTGHKVFIDWEPVVGKIVGKVPKQ